MDRAVKAASEGMAALTWPAIGSNQLRSVVERLLRAITFTNCAE